MKERADLSTTRTRNIAGVGRVLLWPGASLWIGHAAGSVDTHAHHAIQISLALSGAVRVREAGGEWSQYAAAMVLPHQRHQFDGLEGSVAQIFVEPETLQGEALRERFGPGTIIRIPDALVTETVVALRQAYATRAENQALMRLAHDAVSRIAGCAAVQTTDVRVTNAIDWMRTRLHRPIMLAEVARATNLSPSRFRHLFVSQTGISFRAYLLWARVSSAVGAAMDGMSWTDAAVTWGFSDAAHLSRTCRRMFGIAPSMLVRESLLAPIDPAAVANTRHHSKGRDTWDE